jgi:hypothetical protein
MLQPRRPLIRTQPGQIRGLAAREAGTRVSELGPERNVYSYAIANPNLSSSLTVTTEL